MSRPRPITRLSTPAGSPARCRVSTNAQALAGTASAGLNTTVLPYASAGAIFHAGIAIGKFHGVMIDDHAHRLARDGHLDSGTQGVDVLARVPHGLPGMELEHLPGARRPPRPPREASCPPRGRAGRRARRCGRAAPCRPDRGSHPGPHPECRPTPPQPRLQPRPPSAPDRHPPPRSRPTTSEVSDGLTSGRASTPSRH